MKSHLRLFWFAFLSIILSVPLQASQPTDTKPNFVIILTDDQRDDTFQRQFMPKTFQWIVDQGLNFKNNFATTPLCCPSRSSILTGLYVSNHKVYSNNVDLDKTRFDETAKFSTVLKNNGYNTAMIGKYLNVWDASPRPQEFDYWIGMPKGDYKKFELYIDGKKKQYNNNGYLTTVLGDFAANWLNKQTNDTPFLLYFAVKAPHKPATPEEKYKNLYLDLPPHRPPSFNEEDLSDKPNWFKDYKKLSRSKIASIDKLRLDQLRTLRSVDDQVDRLMLTLKERGLLDNTVVIFLSDNGFLWGEHRLQAKIRVYDESSRIPMAIRYPPLIQEPNTTTQLTANIDLYPTILELAGLPSPNPVDGQSLVELFTNPEHNLRDHLVIEGWPDDSDSFKQCSPRYAAIREKNLTYVESYRSVVSVCRYENDDKSELYDMVADPFQLDNKIDDPAYALDVLRLKETLRLERAKQTVPYQEIRTQSHED